MTVVPGRTGTARVETLDEPPVTQGELLVSGRLVGVCGTDREIAEGVYGEPPQGEGRLLIELTETAEIEDMPEAAAGIAQLRQIGVPVCIDDFGAGAAAFHYLQEFRVDYVKIDGAFIRAATYGARERGFVAAMVEIARAVDARIVAEMIETEEQAALMADLGVSFGQGWLFGRPGALPGRRR